MGRYILSLAAAALICGILPELVPKGSIQEILKLICGVILSLCILAPVVQADLTELEDWMIPLEEGNSSIAQGENLARNALEERIRQELESYILDKAAELGIQIQVSISLRGDPPLPDSATIGGKLSPNQRHELQDILTAKLGIAKENLKWIG